MHTIMEIDRNHRHLGKFFMKLACAFKIYLGQIKWALLALYYFEA